MHAPAAQSPPPVGGASWEALGTRVELRTSDPTMTAGARVEVERELDAIDRACSRFRADSELSRVNRARGRTVAVGPLLAEALELALRAAELTAGDVDPTLGRALELAGYDRDWNELTEQRPVDPARARSESESPPPLSARVRSGWQALKLDRVAGLVRVPAGMQLDLGATAKAWAADRAANAAALRCGCGVLVSIGGDVASSGEAPAGGWQIIVTDDHRAGPDADGQTISIGSGGLATSSTAVRRWQHDGLMMHHIIDPATGAPVRGLWRTVSVAAASCADANIASTAALVRGARACAWLTELQLPARLVDNDGRVSTVGGWPAEQLALAVA